MRGRTTGGLGAIVLLRLLHEVLALPPGRRPLITIAMIGLHSFMFFGLDGQRSLIRRYAFWGFGILRHGLASREAWTRMIGSQWIHLSAVHLGYNMLSFLSKGIQLEHALGGARFIALLASLALMTPLATLAIGVLADHSFGAPDWLDERAVGFSGVLFALKTVLSLRAETSAYSSIYGFRIPTRLVSWAELFLTQLFVPGTSFVGHLGGIVAGLVWAAGVERIVYSALGAVMMLFRSADYRPARSRFYGSGVSGSSGMQTHGRGSNYSAGNHNENDRTRDDAAVARALQEEEFASNGGRYSSDGL